MRYIVIDHYYLTNNLKVDFECAGLIAINIAHIIFIREHTITTMNVKTIIALTGEKLIYTKYTIPELLMFIGAEVN